MKRDRHPLLSKTSPARLIYTKVLTEDEFEQAVIDILALGDDYVHEFSVRLLAALMQDKVKDRETELVII